jgi:hypothetical protein
MVRGALPRDRDGELNSHFAAEAEQIEHYKHDDEHDLA